MKTLFYLMIFLIFLSVSCQKEELNENLIPEELYGLWVHDWPGMEGEIRTSYEFKKDSDTEGISEWRWEAYMHDTLGWTVVGIDQGNFTIKSNIISVYIDRWGTQQYEPMSDYFHHEIQWYTRDDEEFSLYGGGTGQYEFAFKFSGNDLLISEDDNGNGIYEDSEYVTYVLKY